MKIHLYRVHDHSDNVFDVMKFAKDYGMTGSAG